MKVLSVPFFMGRPMRDFEVPNPFEVLDPALPGNASYDPSHAGGPNGTAQRRMSVLYAHLADAVADDGPTLVYAGDCLAVIGVLAGLQRKGIDPTLYWFDAHGDFHTWETTPSRFLGGMPLAMLTGRGEQTIVEHVGLTPVDDERVALVDARDLDAGEDRAVTRSKIRHLIVADVIRETPPDGPIYVHVDVDVADPQELPAVNYPAPDGPSVADVRAAVRRLASSGRVVAASVSSWNPALPDAHSSALATRSIMEVFLHEEMERS